LSHVTPFTCWDPVLSMKRVKLGMSYFVYRLILVITARNELRRVLFLAPSVTFFMYEISRGSLNGFAPNSHGRLIWSLVRTSLNVKVKGQRSRSPGTKTAFFALSAACVRFLFGKTSSPSRLVTAKLPTDDKLAYPYKTRSVRGTSVDYSYLTRICKIGVIFPVSQSLISDSE